MPPAVRRSKPGSGRGAGRAAGSGQGIRVWRITSPRHVGDAFTGEGARLYGGRWNPPGVALVYTSSTLSLCALEYFVHLDPTLAPDRLAAIPADLPAGFEVPLLPLADLPADWRSYPAPGRLQDIGSAWVREARSFALRVPSAIIPDEHNILLNPRHPDHHRLRVHAAQAFSFDPRMWK
jgi:RES domain-containing protein